MPYINVDEAKRALFQGAKLRSFHFVVYRKEKANWLVFAARMGPEERTDMRDWEKVFGEGFVAVVAKQRADGDVQFRNLNGELLTLE